MKICWGHIINGRNSNMTEDPEKKFHGRAGVSLSLPAGAAGNWSPGYITPSPQADSFSSRPLPVSERLWPLCFLLSGAVGQGYGDKIFYLTAKTITRTVAQEAFALLKEMGLSYKTLTITAKEKLCCLEEPDCNPEKCPYAKGHFDRVNEAVFELLTERDTYFPGRSSGSGGEASGIALTKCVWIPPTG